MNKKALIALGLSISFAPVFCNNILTWHNQVTHKDLSEYAAENSKISKDKGDYLKNVRFNSVLDEFIAWGSNTKTIRTWLRDDLVPVIVPVGESYF